MSSTTCIDTTPTSINVTASELHSRLHLWWRVRVGVNSVVLLYGILALLVVAYDVLALHHDVIVALLWCLVGTSAAALLMTLHGVEYRGHRLLANLRMLSSGLLDNHQSLKAIETNVVEDMDKVHVFCVPLVKLTEHRNQV